MAVIEPEQALTVQRPSLLDIIDRASREKVDVATLKELWAMNLEFEANEAKKAYHEDMARFKADMPVILKTKHVQQPDKADGTKRAQYWHAELDKACPILIAALIKYNFTHHWETVENTKDWIAVSCVIQHKQGHAERTTLGGPPDATGGKNAIQAIGSTKFYLERYTLFAALGIAPKGKDDDGAGGGIDNGWLAEQVAEIERCETKEGLIEAFKAAATAALGAKDINAYTVLKEAKDKRGAKLK